MAGIRSINRFGVIMLVVLNAAGKELFQEIK